MKKKALINAGTYGHQLALRVDAAGRPQPPRKCSLAELERRRDHVARLWRKGASRRQIATALDVSSTTVDKDLETVGIVARRRYQGLAQDPGPIEWLDPPGREHRPAGPHRPAYQSSVTLRIWAVFIREAREQHHANRLAHDAADADEAHDAVWLAEAAETLQAAITEATRLHKVVTDQAARLRGQREEDDEQRPGLRAVQ